MGDGLLCCLLEYYQVFSPSLKRVDHESWRKMTDQDKKNCVEKIYEELADSADEWGQGSLNECGGPWGDGKGLSLNLLSASNARRLC